ncbi:MAG TPA: aminoglycoside phosphotransferase family protein, partial [Pyrinomonadaceae bacterium]|nr:aminoglycoside phosphotransferase family protein [Pyrinomonadaceae bacterium]
DPALPQRDLLLDETVMAQYLSRLVTPYGALGVQKCERLRTKYRVGTSLRVLYRVEGVEQSYRIAARAFPKGRRVDRQSTEIHATELNTSFWLFPNDRKIRNLSVLNDIPADLRKIQGQQWTKSRIVGHAPEKSLTAQCIDENDAVLAYAKIYAGDEGRQTFNTYVHVNAELDQNHLRVPRALSYSGGHHLLLLESLPGVSLSALKSWQRKHSFFLLGRALRALHDISPPMWLPRSTRLTPEALTRATTTISQARPDVAGLVQRLSDRLLQRKRAGCEDEPALLHGDVHPKNILINNDRVYLLDLDQAAVGNALVDLASVIAGLYCASCVGALTWSEAVSLRRTLLAGYGQLKNSTSLQWHIAAALLTERALRSVTRIRLENLQRLPDILATAEAVLNGGLSEN